jgi:hypothetical protein
MSGAYWFNPADHDPTRTGGGQALPVGKYPVVITGCSKEDSQNNSNNAMLVFTLQAIDGPNKGASGAYRLNIWHEKTTVREIAHNQLAAVCAVTGVGGLTNGCPELFGKPFVVDVVPQPNNDKGYTQVNSVFDMQGQPPKKGAPAPANTAPPAQAWAGQAPAAAPPAQAAPSWQPPQQPAQPAQAAPSWQPPGVGGAAQAAPAAPAAGAQPSWAQGPSQAKPSW